MRGPTIREGRESCAGAGRRLRTKLVQCTSKLPGAVGTATLAMLCLNTWVHWALQLLQCRVPAGTATPPGPGPERWGTGGQPRQQWKPTECLWGTAARRGPDPPAGEMQSRAKAAVGVYRVPMGDGSPLRPRAHQPGGREVLPRRPWVPTECLRGTAAPCAPGPLAGRTGSPAKAALCAYSVPLGDGNPMLPGPTKTEDGEFCLGGGGCLHSAFRKR